MSIKSDWSAASRGVGVGVDLDDGEVLLLPPPPHPSVCTLQLLLQPLVVVQLLEQVVLHRFEQVLLLSVIGWMGRPGWTWSATLAMVSSGWAIRVMLSL